MGLKGWIWNPRLELKRRDQEGALKLEPGMREEEWTCFTFYYSCSPRWGSSLGFKTWV